MTDEAKERGRWQGHAWILAGRKPALAAAQGHGPRRLCLHRRTRRFSVPPSGAHAGAGVGNGKKSCAFHFFNRGNRSKKKKSPKTSPGPATVPATHLRAVPGGGGGVHARPEFPTPRSALPSPRGGGCSGEPTGEAALFPPRGR